MHGAVNVENDNRELASLQTPGLLLIKKILMYELAYTETEHRKVVVRIGFLTMGHHL